MKERWSKENLINKCLRNSDFIERMDAVSSSTKKRDYEKLRDRLFDMNKLALSIYQVKEYYGGQDGKIAKIDEIRNFK